MAHQTLMDLCAEHGLTLGGLSRETGISRGAIAGWNTGRRKPTTAHAKVIAQALGIELAAVVAVTGCQNEEIERTYRALSKDDLK